MDKKAAIPDKEKSLLSSINIYEIYDIEHSFDAKFKQNKIFYIHHFSKNNLVLEPGIADLVVVLNMMGITTEGSCHGHHPDEPKEMNHLSLRYSLPCIAIKNGSNYTIVDIVIKSRPFKWKIKHGIVVGNQANGENSGSIDERCKQPIINPGSSNYTSQIIVPDVDGFDLEKLKQLREEAKSLAREIYFHKK